MAYDDEDHLMYMTEKLFKAKMQKAIEEATLLGAMLGALFMAIFIAGSVFIFRNYSIPGWN